jgi:hypothetical protein
MSFGSPPSFLQTYRVPNFAADLLALERRHSFLVVAHGLRTRLFRAKPNSPTLALSGTLHVVLVAAVVLQEDGVNHGHCGIL